MKRTWPIIGVKDVAASASWYQTLLGLPEQRPGHDDFSILEDADATVLLCLHEWGGHGESRPLRSPEDAEPGNGILLFFRVDDYDEALARARRLVPALEAEPHISGPNTWAFTVRDPDGYYVTVNAL